MGFEFRLERVLRYREEQERQALLSFARTQAQRDLVSSGLFALDRELEEVRGFFKGLKGNPVNPQELLLLGRRWRWLALQRERQEQLLEEWDKKVQEAHEAWLQARAAKKVLVKLRERAFRDFLGKMERAELRELDEVGLRGFFLAEASSAWGLASPEASGEGG